MNFRCLSVWNNSERKLIFFSRRANLVVFMALQGLMEQITFIQLRQMDSATLDHNSFFYTPCCRHRLGANHKLRWQVFGFFDYLPIHPPLVDIVYLINAEKKSTVLDYLPTSFCKCSLGTTPGLIFLLFSAQHLDLVHTHILHLTVCFIQKQTRPTRLVPRPRVFGTKW